MKLVTRLWLTGAFVAGLSACATGPEAQRVAESDIDSAAVGETQGQTRYVRVTGSRIRYRVSDDGTAPVTSFPIVGYSQDDIQFTGVRDMQGALIVLDPRID